MRCEHGNIVHLCVRDVSKGFSDDGQAFYFVGCDQCPGMDLAGCEGHTTDGCHWIANDGQWHELGEDD